jgi:N-methylhydantoinase A
MSWRIGVDVGGTFTDLVATNDEGATHAFKTPSTLHDPSVGVLNVLRTAASTLGLSIEQLLGNCGLFIHGTTVATNILLEGKGARVGLLTTFGFRDALEIRRGLRETPWDHRSPNPPVLVPRYLRIGVRGRIDRDGREIEPLDEEDVAAAADLFTREEVNAVAICFLNSFLSPTHERRAAELIAQHWKGKWISQSNIVAPMIGEYERTSTTVINAYVGPRTIEYLQRLDKELRRHGLPRPLLLMQSNGGAISIKQVASVPYTLLLSGPAAAVGALRYLSRAIGSGDLISMEIGGTSCDVLLLDRGQIAVADQLTVAGYHLSTPAVDIHTIGAGGGTIAGVDKAGLLFAGPQGAGADPGPAAYGRGGTDPTVTDALIVLGRLKPASYGDGTVRLNPNFAVGAVNEQVAGPLGIDPSAAAAGIVRLVEQNLLHAVQRISVERGYDPRRFVLVAAGGAGPMHGARIGRLLGCRQVYVPRLSGALCAYGMLHSDVRHDFVRTALLHLDGADPAELSAMFAALEEHGRWVLYAEGFGPGETEFQRTLGMRYVGQQWDIPISLDGADPSSGLGLVRDRFEREHSRLFGHMQPEGSIEIIRLRSTAIGRLRHAPAAAVRPADAAPQPVEMRRVYVDEQSGWLEIPIYAGGELAPGHVLRGPLIIDELMTTVLIGVGDRVEVDAWGNYLVHMESAT